MLSLSLLCLFANVSPSRGAALGGLLAEVRNDDKIYVHMPHYHVDFRTASGNNIAILQTGIRIYFYSKQAQNKQIHIITISHHTSNIISFPIDVAVMGRKQWVFVGAVSSTQALNWYSLLPDSAHAFLCGFVAAASNWQRRCCCPLGMALSNCTPCTRGTVGLAALLGQSDFHLLTRWMLTVEYLFAVDIKPGPLATLIWHHFKVNSITFTLSSLTNVFVA